MSLIAETVISSLSIPKILEKEGRVRIRPLLGFPDEVKRKILLFLRGKKSTPVQFQKINYKKVLSWVTHPTNASQAEWLAHTITDPEVASDVAARMVAILHYLNGQLPRNISMTVTGPEINKPSRSEMARFERLWNIAINPLSILDNLDQISTDEALGLEQMYPDIYNLIKKTTVDLITNRKASGKKLTRDQDRSINKLLLTEDSPNNTDISAGLEIQKAFSGEDDQKSGSNINPNIAKQNLTPGQRADSSGK